MAETFMGVTEAAKVLGISTRRVQQLIADGYLKSAIRFGRTFVVPRADVERLAREGWPGRRRRAPDT